MPERKEMNKEARKSTYERSVFTAFLERSGLQLDRSSIQTGKAALREPDLLCTTLDGKRIGFELARLTDPHLARAMRRRNPENGSYVRTSPSNGIPRDKFRKTYRVEFPVELLLYTEHPMPTPENVLLPTIEPMCRTRHRFSKIWFMGRSIKLLYERER
jgi:hypothetical protein